MFSVNVTVLAFGLTVWGTLTLRIQAIAAMTGKIAGFTALSDKVPQRLQSSLRQNRDMGSLLALSLILGQDKTVSLAPTTLKDIDDKQIVLPAPEAKATVLMFIAVDCPISNRYAPEMSRIQSSYAPKGVSFIRVYVDDSVELADIRQHGLDFKLAFPAILDGKHTLVKALGMTVTPEVAVVTKDGTLKYRGRITDMYAEHGRVKDNEIRQDLRVALDEVLAGKTVTTPFTTAIGCGIPDGD